MTQNVPTIHFHKNDLPDDAQFGDIIAVDCETMGLNHFRDPLCVVQLSTGDNTAHVVQVNRANYDAPNLKALLGNDKVTKIFHFARFDVATIKKHLGVDCAPVYCTKIASKLVRTYTDKHGLRQCCKELAGVELNKQNQSSDWGADTLTQAQIEYAASDVLYLHKIKEELDKMLVRENRMELAKQCFNFLPARAELDLTGWGGSSFFSH